MEEFNADKAREIAEQSVSEVELKCVLDGIKLFAQKGERQMHVYIRLHGNTLSELRKRGFNVLTNRTMIPEKFYYTITW